MAPAESTVYVEYDLQPAGVRLEVRHGTLVAERSDAIVNAANSKLKHLGGLAHDIARHGGDDVRTESQMFVDRFGPLAPGKAMSTGAGALPCKRVIHAVGPVYRGGGAGEADLLRQACLSALALCDKLKLTSVSIPAISSGIFGFPVEEVAQITVQAVVDYFTTIADQTYLGSVRFTNIDLPTVAVYVAEFERRFGAKPVKPLPDLPPPGADPPRRHRSQRVKVSAPPAAVTRAEWFWRTDSAALCAYDEGSMRALEDAFQSGAADANIIVGPRSYEVSFKGMRQRNLESNVIRDVVRKFVLYSPKPTAEPASATATPDTSSKFVPRRPPKRPVLDDDDGDDDGDGDGDAAMPDAAATSKRARTGTGAKWEWQDDDGDFQAYSATVCEAIEAAFAKSSSECTIAIAGQPYRIDLDNYVQQRVSTGAQRQIRRSASTQAPARPAKWLWADGPAFNAYKGDVNQEIERAYQKGDKVVAVRLGSNMYDIDFGKMQQINPSTGYARAIKREGGSSAAPPPAAAPAAPAAVWQWRNDLSLFTPYDPAVSAEIERAHAAGKDEAQIKLGSHAYVIEFRNMCQRNPVTKRSRPVRRVDKPKGK